jgi:hypothetical protein
VPTLSTSTTSTSGTTTTTDTSGGGSSGGGGSGSDSGSTYQGSGEGEAQTWPAGTSGYTIVIYSLSQKNYTKNDAQSRAAQAQSKGVSSGVIDSNNYSSLTANLWVVFSGIFETESDAEAEISSVQAKGYQGAYVRRVAP